MNLNIFFLIFIISKILTSPSCTESKNYCEICNPFTNLCSKCMKKNILIPDNNGGCIGAQKCELGENYCNECDEEGKICKICEKGFYPDENGGCSFTGNCKISHKGQCLECINDYILIGKKNELSICKYLFSEDFNNCKEIYILDGTCKTCNEGYYLNKGDQKCSNVKNCYESKYSNCISCNTNYYYDKKENICKIKKDNLILCKQTIDGINCDICDDDNYFDENGICVSTKYCSKSQNGKCEKCKNEFYLSSNFICINTKNCLYANENYNLCTTCNNSYYLDTKDYKCKSNIENNEFKHCKKVENNICIECENNFYLSENLQCVPTEFCLEAENGKCKKCIDNYYLVSESICNQFEHCIITYYDECIECEKNYYYNKLYKKCLIAENNFENCKISDEEGKNCSECINDFYLNMNNNLCYNNTKKGNLYKCLYTDDTGEKCDKCINGYYLGSVDKKCTLIKGCKISENESICIECDENYCFDRKNKNCHRNDILGDINIKIYLSCIITNEKGNKCEKCLDGFKVGDEGYCIDVEYCEEKIEGKCKSCKDGKDGTSYCANEIFGCVKTKVKNCLNCNNLYALNTCTECKRGYMQKYTSICEKIGGYNKN